MGSRGKSPRRRWQPQRRLEGVGRSALEPPCTCAPRVTFGRSQVSSPVLAAAQPHGSSPRPRRPPAPPGAARPKPAHGQCPVRRGVRAGPPLPGPRAPPRSRAAGTPTSRQTLLINRRTLRSRRQRAFISSRRGGPASAPCPRGALPTARYSPGAPSRSRTAATRGRCACRRRRGLPPPPRN